MKMSLKEKIKRLAEFLLVEKEDAAYYLKIGLYYFDENGNIKDAD